MRLAWFTPLPPVRSGISAYSAELLPLLASRHTIDVFVDRTEPRGSAADVAAGPAGQAPLPASDFVPRHTAAPYDLVVYQLGNATCHDYQWPYLTRFPGLVVLHDAGLHHARARALLGRGRADDYRAEFRFNHPDAPPLMTEYAVAGLYGTPYYVWPMRRAVFAASRAVAVHSAVLASRLAAEFPATPVVHVPMGVAAHPPGRPAPHAGTTFVAIGLVTPEKRIPEALRAFARVAARISDARLVLVGDPVDHYDARADARALGADDRVTITGYLPDEELASWLDAADVCLCLRWPTTGETSAAWLRCLAAAKPTIVTDLAHTIDVPSLDPRDWLLAGARPSSATEAARAVCVSIDLVDEVHSLELAMHRLAVDRPLAARLGRAALAHWRAHHTLEAMADGYERALATARASAPDPAELAALPGHLRADYSQVTGGIARQFGVERRLAPILDCPGYAR
jgi:glycosyltransferase involved in cell wall biosynthesis